MNMNNVRGCYIHNYTEKWPVKLNKKTANEDLPSVAYSQRTLCRIRVKSFDQSHKLECFLSAAPLKLPYNWIHSSGLFDLQWHNPALRLNDLEKGKFQVCTWNVHITSRWRASKRGRRMKTLITVSDISEMEQHESSEKYGAEEEYALWELSCAKSSLHIKRRPPATNSDRQRHNASIQQIKQKC